MKWKPYSLITLLGLSLLCLFELVSYYKLKQEDKQKTPFLILNRSTSLPIWEGKHPEYSNIDPLLGWSHNADYIVNKGYTLSNNCILLAHYQNNIDTLKIYISGGSTSDLLYDEHNWPAQLFEILSAQEQNIEIYIAAVAGYSSGQELLKVIRDMNSINADIHISYSGANESENPSYVSDYELQNYKQLLSGPKILPNTITLLKNCCLSQQAPTFNYPVKYNALSFWSNNMKSMDALAKAHDYSFVAILQPIFKFHEHLNDSSNQSLNFFAKEYIQFYPKARELSDSLNYVYDLSTLFDKHEGEVFKDDCHLSDIKYQKTVAQEILKRLNLELE